MYCSTGYGGGVELSTVEHDSALPPANRLSKSKNMTANVGRTLVVDGERGIEKWKEGS